MPSTRPPRQSSPSRSPAPLRAPQPARTRDFVQPSDILEDGQPPTRHRYRHRRRAEHSEGEEGRSVSRHCSHHHRHCHHREEQRQTSEASRAARWLQQDSEEGGEYSSPRRQRHSSRHRHHHRHHRHHHSSSHHHTHTHSHAQVPQRSRTNTTTAQANSVHPDAAQRAIVDGVIASKKKKQQQQQSNKKKSWLERLRTGTRSFVADCLAGFQSESSDATRSASVAPEAKARPRISNPMGIAMLSPIGDGPPRHVSAPVESKTGPFANVTNVQKPVPPPKTPPRVPPKDTKKTKGPEYHVYVANAEEKKLDVPDMPCTPWPRIYLDGEVVSDADEEYRLSHVVREMAYTYAPPPMPSADIASPSALKSAEKCLYCARPPAESQQLCSTCSGLGFTVNKRPSVDSVTDAFSAANIQGLRERITELTTSPKPAVPPRSSKRQTTQSSVSSHGRAPTNPFASPCSPRQRHPLSSASSSSSNNSAPSPSDMIVPPRTSMYARRVVLNSSNNPASAANPPLRRPHPSLRSSTDGRSDASLRFSVAQNPFTHERPTTKPLAARRAQPALTVRVPGDGNDRHRSVYGDIKAPMGSEDSENEWESSATEGEDVSPSSLYSRATKCEPKRTPQSPKSSQIKELERLLQLKRWEKGDGWDRVMGSVMERQTTRE